MLAWVLNAPLLLLALQTLRTFYFFKVNYKGATLLFQNFLKVSQNVPNFRNHKIRKNVLSLKNLEMCTMRNENEQISEAAAFFYLFKKINNSEMLLLLICIQKYIEKNPRKLLKLMQSVAFWKTRESNFKVQATYQLLVAAMQNKSRRYWMVQYNQSLFENMWVNR